MKRFLFLLILLGSLGVSAQHQGIGLRMGSPFGLTYKKYVPNSTHAIEMVLGFSPPAWSNHYYRKSFDSFSRFDNTSYLGHTVKGNVQFQGRYLKQYTMNVEGVSGKFEWYWGGGLFIKMARIKYDYVERNNLNFGSSTISDIDVGPEIPLGLEYEFEKYPLTVFSEVGVFAELVNRPGVMQLKGAIGLRYNFFNHL